MTQLASRIFLFSLAMLCALSLRGQQGDFEFGKNKISIDVLSMAMGRTTFLSSEIGLVYHRRISNENLEISGRLGYSTLNLILGGAPMQDSLGNDTGYRLRDQAGGDGFSVGSAIQHNVPLKGQRWFFYGIESNFTYTHFFSKEPTDGPDHMDLRKLNTSLFIGLRWYLKQLGMEVDALAGIGAAFRNYDWEDSSSSSGEVASDGWNYDRSVGLILEPSIALSIPLALRVGWRF